MRLRYTSPPQSRFLDGKANVLLYVHADAAQYRSTDFQTTSCAAGLGR